MTLYGLRCLCAIKHQSSMNKVSNVRDAERAQGNTGNVNVTGNISKQSPRREHTEMRRGIATCTIACGEKGSTFFRRGSEESCNFCITHAFGAFKATHIFSTIRPIFLVKLSRYELLKWKKRCRCFGADKHICWLLLSCPKVAGLSSIMAPKCMASSLLISAAFGVFHLFWELVNKSEIIFKS